MSVPLIISIPPSLSHNNHRQAMRTLASDTSTLDLMVAGALDDDDADAAAGESKQAASGAGGLRTASAVTALSEFAAATQFCDVDIQKMYGVFRAAADGAEGEPRSLTKEAFRGATASLTEFGVSAGVADSAFFDFLFAAFDLDGNGTLSLQEFAFGLNVLSLGTQGDKLEFAFKLFDTDNNGTIEVRYSMEKEWGGEGGGGG